MAVVPKIIFDGTYSQLTPSNPVLSAASISTSTATTSTIGTSGNSTLDIETNGVVRLSIPGTGIPTVSPLTSILTLNGNTIESMSLALTNISNCPITGFSTAVTTNLSYLIFNSSVLIRLSTFAGMKSGNGVLTITTSLPAAARPSQDTVVYSLMDGADTYAAYRIKTTGNIEVSRYTGIYTSGLDLNTRFPVMLKYSV